MTIFPFPTGTRHTVLQLGQVKYLCSLSIRCCRPLLNRRLMGHQTFCKKAAFSARRFSRFRENTRNSAHSTSTVVIMPTTPDTAVFFVSMLITSSRMATQIMHRPS